MALQLGAVPGGEEPERGEEIGPLADQPLLAKAHAAHHGSVDPGAGHEDEASPLPAALDLADGKGAGSPAGQAIEGILHGSDLQLARQHVRGPQGDHPERGRPR